MALPKHAGLALDRVEFVPLSSRLTTCQSRFGVMDPDLDRSYRREDCCHRSGKASGSTPDRHSGRVVSAQLPSHIYYFQVGAGGWAGTFRFRVTGWREMLRARIGFKNLLLVAAMQATQTVTGESRLTSVVVPHPDEGERGVVDNAVRLSRFRIPLYDLHERYILSPDGQGVRVVAREHFGPIPLILSRGFEYPAQIRADGLGSTYHMPLLGSPWTAIYQVGTAAAASPANCAAPGPKRTSRQVEVTSHDRGSAARSSGRGRR